jgi:hypothetical protein
VLRALFAVVCAVAAFAVAVVAAVSAFEAFADAVNPRSYACFTALGVAAWVVEVELIAVLS